MTVSPGTHDKKRTGPASAASIAQKSGYFLTCNLLVAYSLCMDEVFKALADPHRRQILDRLYVQDGQALQALCRDVDMSRQGLSKHLAILEAAGLIVTVFEGREKLHYLNPVPIQAVAERWIEKYSTAQLTAVSSLKKALEEKD